MVPTISPSSILGAALSSGNPALAIITDYSEALEMIERAVNLTQSANATLQQVQAALEALAVGALEEEVEELEQQARDFKRRALLANASAAGDSVCVPLTPPLSCSSSPPPPPPPPRCRGCPVHCPDPDERLLVPDPSRSQPRSIAGH